MNDLRQHFNLDPDSIILDGMLLSSHPRIVREAIARHQNAFDKAPGRYWIENVRDQEQACRIAAARYIGALPDEIALTDSATMSLGIFYAGLVLPSGSEILVSDQDHFSSLKAASYAAARSDYRLRQMSWYEDPANFDAKQCPSRLLAQISENTRVVQVTWVHSSTGVMLPLAAIGAAISALNLRRKNKILLVVDAVHAFGVEPIEVNSLNCDVIVASCHKWLFGPHGTGLMWLKAGMEQFLRPTIPCYDMGYYQNWQTREETYKVPFAAQMSPGGFHSFAYRWTLQEAFLFHEELGKDFVADYTKGLARHLYDLLSEVPGIQLVTPKIDKCSLICFQMPGLDSRHLVQELKSIGIYASTTPYYHVYARFSPALFNTEQDINTAVDAIRRLGKAVIVRPAV